MLRLVIALMLFTAPALADCNRASYNGTYSVFTDPMEMNGLQCSSHCYVRIKDGEVLAGTTCRVRFYDPLLKDEWTEVYHIAGGSLSVPSANARRYAESNIEWAMDNGVSFSSVLAQREHDWIKRKDGTRTSKCKPDHSIHGQAFSPGFGLVGFDMVWRGQSVVQP